MIGYGLAKSASSAVFVDTSSKKKDSWNREIYDRSNFMSMNQNGLAKRSTVTFLKFFGRLAVGHSLLTWLKKQPHV